MKNTQQAIFMKTYNNNLVHKIILNNFIKFNKLNVLHMVIMCNAFAGVIYPIKKKIS